MLRNSEEKSCQRDVQVVNWGLRDAGLILLGFQPGLAAAGAVAVTLVLLLLEEVAEEKGMRFAGSHAMGNSRTPSSGVVFNIQHAEVLLSSINRSILQTVRH